MKHISISMRTLLISITLLFFSISVFSQNIYTGKVTDNKKEPIAFANVVVYSTINKALEEGSITDENGSFTVELNSEEGFYIEVSFLGFETKKIDLNQVTNLGKIVLEENSNALDEVVIRAKKQSLIRKNDRLIFNINNTAVQEMGSAVDVLKVTPNIVMRDDKLTMLGKNSVRVMINGKMMPLKGDDLSNYLSSINSSNITAVEVITVPPSEFESEGNGGIINIILKKQKSDFWSVVARLSLAQRTQFSYGDNLALNYKNKNTYLTASISNGKYVRNNIFNNNYYYNNEIWQGKGPNRYQNDYLNYRIAIIQNITNKWEVGVNYTGSNSDNKNQMDNIDEIYNLSNILKYSFDSKGLSKEDTNSHAFNINNTFMLDSLGKNISLDFDYYKSTSLKKGDNDGKRIENNITSSTFSNRTSIDYDFSNFSSKIDFSLPYKKIKIKVGGKVSISETNNDFKFYDTFSGSPVFDENQSNIFTYNENIFGVYVSGSKQLTKKIAAKVGLRAEKTVTKSYSKSNNKHNNNDYIKLFPTLFVTYNLKDKKSISFNFSKRLNRPSFESLDPFKIIINPFKTVQGNPFLKPSYITKMEFIYNTKKNELKFYTQKIDDDYEQISEINSITKVVNYTYYNHINTLSYGITDTYIFDKLDWLTSYNTVDVGYTKMSSSIAQTIGKQEGFNAFMQTQNYIKLNSSKTFSLGVNYYYVFPSKVNLYHSEGYGPLDLSLRLKLLDGNLSLSMYANDILNSSRSLITSSYNGVRATYKNYYDSRSVSFNIRYTFGNKKINTKSSRSGNTDIQNRAK